MVTHFDIGGLHPLGHATLVTTCMELQLVAENALVIFTSDNGGLSSVEGKGGRLQEGGIGKPLIPPAPRSEH